MALTLSLDVVRPAGRSAAPMPELTADYLRRCRHGLQAQLRVWRTEEALLAAAAAERKRGAAGLWIADTAGETLSSEAFAGRVRQARDAGLRSLSVAIGPPDGWSPAARSAADFRLSLGPMTLPHELAALVLAEQIYRAGAILQGHPYHLGH